ncbi:MAG: VanZ family protein [Candidatus Aenigmarchaeota archaeon]|nr:VanZ family protein [Candidatus Aenigmarchaeota archaeon]
MKDKTKAFIFLSLAIAETLVLVWFSLQPSAAFVPSAGFLRSGDLEHLVAYVVYGFMWSAFFLTYKKRPGVAMTILLSLAIGSAIGALCETLQLFVPTRVADPLDWAIDSLGSLCGAAAAVKARNLF